MAVTETTRLAVLIDADNASASVVKELWGYAGEGLRAMLTAMPATMRPKAAA